MAKPHIVIVGSGISALSACWHLKDDARITLIEKNNYLGGHTHTHKLDVSGHEITVDTGFIVYNQKTYPGLTSWFDELEVRSHAAKMSFSVSANEGSLEWSGESLNAVFAQRHRLFDIKFWRMLSDVLRFNRSVVKDLHQNPDLAGSTIGLSEYLELRGYSDYFKHYYLYPMAGAIWSCSTSTIEEFSLQSFVNFFDNHGLLSVADQPQWFSIDGGSQQYTKKLFERLRSNSVTILRSSEALTINRSNSGNEIVYTTNGLDRHRISCDQIVLGCHADESSKLIEAQRHPATEILRRIPFQRNTAYLHSDISLMPRNKRAWAAWNYLHKISENADDQISVTYFMNQLQNLKQTTQPILVSLNPIRPPDAKVTYKKMEYSHPNLSRDSERAVSELSVLQGTNEIWHAGAWLGNGFHESGFQSGKTVAKKIRMLSGS